MDYVAILTIAVPVVVSIVGLWFRTNNLIIRQDMKIQSLEEEIKEMKRHNERKEELMLKKLDSIEEKINTFVMHFSKCSNFSTKG